VEDATGAVTCEWDFGDGSPKVKETNPTHVYERVDDYEVLVVCRDEIGTVGEGETDVFVEPDEASPETSPTR
jgi:PKD repeat protein